MVNVGEKYGRLTVKKVYKKVLYGSKTVVADCVCECGNTTTIPADRLTRGSTKSCGCRLREMLRNGDIRRKHGGRGTRLYQIWKSMRERCNTVTNDNYPKYGARGITVCREWDDFAVFRDWARANGYDDTLTIDRIDPYGGYSPDNCRWATYTEQARNKTNNRWLEYKGERRTVAEWSERIGISQSTIHERLKHGWSVERALGTPLFNRGQKKIS